MSKDVRSSAAIAPGSLDFALHTLGWRNFQDLSAVILREFFGQTFKAFADSNDGGRDGAFYGKWVELKGKNATPLSGISEGATVTQCKFMSKPGATLTPADIKDELAKIKRLVGKGLCKNYVLMTNAVVSGKSEEKIVSSIKALGVSHVEILDGSWICQTISLSQNLRLYVPRFYGLGDLSKILDERAYTQARSLLDYLKDDLATFVITDAYIKAADALKKHSFVFLVGEPASGKSVIAASLAVAAIDNWKCLAIKVNGPKEMLERWDPNEPGQFFWIDDAFGATYYDRSLTDQWIHALPDVGAAIKKGARIVITSRDYIYKEASGALKEYSYPFLREQQIVVRVNDLSTEEKEKILYNHIRLGDQSKEFKTAIKPHLEGVSKVERFLPEVARRLGNKMFSKDLDASDEEQIIHFMDRPSEFLQDVLKGLPPEHLAALYLVYQSGKLESPVMASTLHKNIITRLGQDESTILRALSSLEGTFLRLTGIEERGSYNRYWEFKHPTLREGLSTFLSTQPELLEVLIMGMTHDEVFTQLSCGRKSKGLLRVPASLYGLVVDKLGQYREDFVTNPKIKDDRMLELRQYQFLERGSKEFLKQCIDKMPKLVKDTLDIWGQLGWDPKIMVLAILKKHNLLNEDDRLWAVYRIEQIAMDTPDATWIDDTSCEYLMTSQERKLLIAKIKKQLLTDFSEVLEEWALSEEDDLESYYEPLTETLEAYSNLFTQDEEVIQKIHRYELEIDERTEQDQEFNEDIPTWDAPSINRAPKVAQQGENRSIFDDVDS